ncbi:MAG: polysaccharide deacetylase family protein [Fidelibacterota bacterium]|nr:MAG: polysaccharide deacetylase family protein [Candidatus Neomarinimicrobiota bacterium]
MRSGKIISIPFLGLMITLCACYRADISPTPVVTEGQTWGERLGFPRDKRVLILHADDLGMCVEANEAGARYLADDRIQSGAIMMPCPASQAMAEWYRRHPTKDIGIHLTLNSEWETYRWDPVTDTAQVPGLIDPEGFMWRDWRVLRSATPEEVELEIRGQIEKALSLGIKPSHIDTHMGTLLMTAGYAEVYMDIAMEYGLPAMVIEFSEPIVERFRSIGFIIDEEVLKLAANYPLPKLDDYYMISDGESYEDKKQKFYELVQSLQPGITEIIFHPSVESDNLKSITDTWQQRAWEAQLFYDDEVTEFLENEGVLFTTWKDIMTRFRQSNP